MICLIKRLIKPFICITFVLSGVDVSAQVSLVQNTIDKIESYKNFSYLSVYKQRDYDSDTTTIQHKDIFSKAPEDKTFGYLFSMETLIKGNKFPYTDLYNGQNLIQITPEDSTYIMKKIQTSVAQGSLLYYLKIIEGLFEKRPSKIDRDTTINGIICSHLIINTYDTIVNKEHYYTRIHLFINKLSGMPDCIITKSRNARIGDRITNYYTEYRYSNYKFDQDNIDIASMTFPEGFHPPKEPLVSPTLLASGKVAPDWILYSAEGKKVSLTQMKGKIILLDFFFIGCEGCMLSLKPLNKLHEKYKNQNVAMISMTFRDSKKSVMEFKKNYKIKYPIYVNAGDVVKLYNVEQFPTFYFIDKEGKIANVIVGYSDNFEEKVTSIINNMLNK
jgi:peroxiredoxin